MSQREKLLQKLCSEPPPADLRWTELCKLLKALGYKQRRNSGSRRKFVHAELKLVISCHKPHPEPCVDRGCIRDVVEHLKANGFVEE